MDDPESRAWCSTRVTPNHFHVGGQRYWGYCEVDSCTQTAVTTAESPSTATAAKKDPVAEEEEEEEEKEASDTVQQVRALNPDIGEVLLI